jgi:hypothetical protein
MGSSNDPQRARATDYSVGPVDDRVRVDAALRNVSGTSGVEPYLDALGALRASAAYKTETRADGR